MRRTGLKGLLMLDFTMGKFIFFGLLTTVFAILTALLALTTVLLVALLAILVVCNVVGGPTLIVLDWLHVVPGGTGVGAFLLFIAVAMLAVWRWAPRVQAEVRSWFSFTLVKLNWSRTKELGLVAIGRLPIGSLEDVPG